MIYTKEANFPYPLLRNNSDDYCDAAFNLDVSLSENQENYLLQIESEISSDFLKKLIQKKQARLLLVIKSKDNQYHILPGIEKHILSIAKNKLSFIKNKTEMQLMIQSIEKISFSENMDLNGFYQPHRDQIGVEAGLVLGFSSVVSFDGSQKKPYDLFDKKLDSTIQSDIEIQLTDEVITIVYKAEAMMFTDIHTSRNLTNPYLYIGLERALMEFIITYADSQDIHEGVDIEELTMSEMKRPLDEKLLKLLKEKQVCELDLNSLDAVIYLISDNILKKYVDRVWRLHYGN